MVKLTLRGMEIHYDDQWLIIEADGSMWPMVTGIDAISGIRDDWYVSDQY